MSDGLSHLDDQGAARMVNVGDKDVTERVAVAQGRVRASDQLLDAIEADSLEKGSLLETARLAGIQAAKRTAELIPLCHPLPLDHVDVDAAVERPYVVLHATVRATSRTGVEMEALTAVAVAALTAYDMGKALDKGMVIEGVRLLHKSGGRSGEWNAPSE